MFKAGTAYKTTDYLDFLYRAERGKNLYEGNHHLVPEINAAFLERLEGFGYKVTGNTLSYDSKIITNNLGSTLNIINVPQSVVDNHSKFLFSEMPDFKIRRKDTEGSEFKDFMVDWCNREGFYSELIEIARDRMVQGIAIWKVRKKNGKAIISHIEPSAWIPIVANDDLTRIEAHAIIKEVFDEANKRYYINVEIHTAGKIEYRSYKLKDASSSIIETAIDYQGILPLGMVRFDEFGVKYGEELTGIDVPTVFTAMYKKKIGSIYPMTAFDTIITQIRELDIRFSQLSGIFDKHADPVMEGMDVSRTEVDEDGNEYRVVNSKEKYVVRNSKDDPETRYVTWDAKYEAIFKFAEDTCNYIYNQMGTTKAAFSIDTASGLSGSALKRLLNPVLLTVNADRTYFDAPLNNTIKVIAVYEGKANSMEELTTGVIFKDGIAKDETEMANICNLNLSNGSISPIMSRVLQFDMSDEEAIKEGERVDEAKRKSMEIELEKETKKANIKESENVVGMSSRDDKSVEDKGDMNKNKDDNMNKSV